MRQSDFKKNMILNWEDSQDNTFMEKERWMYSKMLVQSYLERQ